MSEIDQRREQKEQEEDQQILFLSSSSSQNKSPSSRASTGDINLMFEVVNQFKLRGTKPDLDNPSKGPWAEALAKSNASATAKKDLKGFANMWKNQQRNIVQKNKVEENAALKKPSRQGSDKNVYYTFKENNQLDTEETIINRLKQEVVQEAKAKQAATALNKTHETLETITKLSCAAYAEGRYEKGAPSTPEAKEAEDALLRMGNESLKQSSELGKQLGKKTSRYASNGHQSSDEEEEDSVMGPDEDDESDFATPTRKKKSSKQKVNDEKKRLLQSSQRVDDMMYEFVSIRKQEAQLKERELALREKELEYKLMKRQKSQVAESDEDYFAF